MSVYSLVPRPPDMAIFLLQLHATAAADAAAIADIITATATAVALGPLRWGSSSVSYHFPSSLKCTLANWRCLFEASCYLLYSRQ